MENRKLVFVGITSGRTAISESFLDLISSAPEGSIVLYGQGLTHSDFPAHVKAICVNISRFSLLKSFVEFVKIILLLKRLSRSNDIRILTYSTLPINFIFGMIVSLKNFYVWSHDPSPHTGANFYNSRILPLDFHVCVKYMHARVLCGSISVANFIKSKYKDAHVHTIRFPYISALVNRSDHFASDLSTRKRIDFLFFGRLEEYKGIRVLIEALHLIEKSNIEVSEYIFKRNISVAIAGRGPLMSYIRKQEYKNNVSFQIYDFPSNTELNLLIREAKYCCFPYIDGTGSQVMQSALALGSNIVCSDISLFKEIGEAIDKKYITFFESGNSRVLADTMVSCLEKYYQNNTTQDLERQATAEYSPRTWSDRVVASLVSDSEYHQSSVCNE